MAIPRATACRGSSATVTVSPTASESRFAMPRRSAPPPQTHSVAETEGALKRADRERREEEARAHPATAAVIEAFGAKIKEIKIDG